MRSKLFKVVLLIVVLTLIIPPALSAAENAGAGGQGSASDDQKYVGAWSGSFTTDSGSSAKLSYALKKDEKGRWAGSVYWVNQNGENTAEFITLQIADGKMKGMIESPDGQAEITIEGQFQGDKLEGTYAVSPKNSAEVVEKGTWKVARGATAKPGQ
jgi:hypothetical protein